MKSLRALLILGSFAFAAPGATPIARDGAADMELQSPKSFLLLPLWMISIRHFRDSKVGRAVRGPTTPLDPV
ncbi:hypothetical protein AC579_8937 [Pseudocercospora musae]|uniref:Uncharacterized protein n=1 Tax=Pseudocercospora musae TaxID=113226 RepID=A0A139H8P8_9PEZI|nr:hypothetical protein AC579_8937 [Pseudocercospora musae]